MSRSEGDEAKELAGDWREASWSPSLYNSPASSPPFALRPANTPSGLDLLLRLIIILGQASAT